MKIVIDIPETFYKDCKECCELKWGGYYTSRLMNAIKNSKPLPEHHGLIDRLELSDHIKNRLIQTAMNNMETILPYSKVCTDIVDNRIDTWIDEVKPIIEADKGVLEKINEKQDSLKATCKAWDEAISRDGYVD